MALNQSSTKNCCSMSVSMYFNFTNCAMLSPQIESSLQSEVRSVSSSTELVDDFCLLLERERPFYAVVDGLNMAYIGGNFNINFVSMSIIIL